MNEFVESYRLTDHDDILHMYVVKLRVMNVASFVLRIAQKKAKMSRGDFVHEPATSRHKMLKYIKCSDVFC